VTIAGRHVFDMTDGWDGTPPGGVDHVVVVTHRPEPEGWDPRAPFHFVDGVEAAVTKAQELAGDRIVEVAAGDVGGQVLAAGLIDEVRAQVVQNAGALARLLQLDAAAVQDLRDKLEKSHGFAPVEVASGLDWDRFAAVSVRLPELPGVVTQRGFSRYYPTGPCVGHLVGYVGAASAEEYEKEKDPILVTPGSKVGKDGLEKIFEKDLRGKPGARRVEVTAGGRVVRDLETREDVPGKPIKLTIDGPLQDYAARRIGLESGAVVVMEVETGDILAMASMPSYDPNSFSDGIGRIEWKMLSGDDHVPLRNKVLRGLYPPGSTVKPMVSMALMQAGVDPEETVFCGGGLRVGNRVFGCWNRRGHG
jgi:penicillin-binding protein 2